MAVLKQAFDISKVLTIFVFLELAAVSGQDDNNCFQFTWPGPQFKIGGTDNATSFPPPNNCESLGQPCRNPIVATFDGTAPNTTALWNLHNSSVSCRRGEGEVCAKYTVMFDNKVLNVTRMCTKIEIEDEGAMTYGCEISTGGSYTTEICACQGRKNGISTEPCNSTSGATPNGLFLFALALVLVVVMCRR